MITGALFIMQTGGQRGVEEVGDPGTDFGIGVTPLATPTRNRNRNRDHNLMQLFDRASRVALSFVMNDLNTIISFAIYSKTLRIKVSESELHVVLFMI